MAPITIQNFTCGYPKGFRVGPLNISWEPGSIGGIIGRNGSGKSTLFKGLMGDIPSSGNFLLGDLPLGKIPLKRKATKMAIVQQFLPTAPITVEDYVLLGRLPYLPKFSFSFSEHDKTLALKKMEDAGVDHLRHRLLTEISGGELQMVSVAKALAQEPAILLLDEPTSHLDITYQTKIIALLKQVLKQNPNLLVLMIIHDLNQASEWCDTVSLISKGQLLAHGSPNSVLTPQLIKQAYNVDIAIHNSPITGRPIITNKTSL